MKNMIGVLAFSVALGAAAESSISQMVVNQRWPWNEKVDVDFVLSGETNDVEVTAQWDQHPEPYRLGTLFDCAPGQRRFTWDPASSPFAGQTLTGFTVTVSNASASAHNYIVVDLVNGGYEFLAEPPGGVWAAEHKSSKMVFRRIPAGTYTLGEPLETFRHLKHYNPGSVTTTNCNRRTVTFTSDFYVGIYKYTEAQHARLVGETQSESYIPKVLAYNALRGEKTAEHGDWPTTGYKVAPDSVVAKLRAKAGADLLVDLCEEGKAQNTVGRKSANAWGIFDASGLAGEWTLDTAKNTGSYTFPDYGLPDDVTDPVGVSGGTWRIIKSANGDGNKTAIYDLLPCRRQMAAPDSALYSTRFCIHLKPLVREGGQP